MDGAYDEQAADQPFLFLFAAGRPYICGSAVSFPVFWPVKDQDRNFCGGPVLSVSGSDAGGVLVYIWQAPVRPVPHVLPVWLRLNAVCAPLK